MFVTYQNSYKDVYGDPFCVCVGGGGGSPNVAFEIAISVILLNVRYGHVEFDNQPCPMSLFVSRAPKGLRRCVQGKDQGAST